MEKQILRIGDVIDVTGLDRSTIYKTRHTNDADRRL